MRLWGNSKNDFYCNRETNMISNFPIASNKLSHLNTEIHLNSDAGNMLRLARIGIGDLPQFVLALPSWI